MRLPPFLPLAALLAAPAVAAGQSATRFAGVSYERFSESDERFVTLAFRRTDLWRDGVGVDFGLGLVPEALGARIVLMEVEAGMAAARTVGPVTLLLKGGVSSFVATWAENEFYPGLDVGVAALVPLERRCSLRLDLSRHFYFPQDETFRLWSLGVGLSVRSWGRGGRTQGNDRLGDRVSAPPGRSARVSGRASP